MKASAHREQVVIKTFAIDQIGSFITKLRVEPYKRPPPHQVAEGRKWGAGKKGEIYMNGKWGFTLRQ